MLFYLQIKEDNQAPFKQVVLHRSYITTLFVRYDHTLKSSVCVCVSRSSCWASWIEMESVVL